MESGVYYASLSLIIFIYLTSIFTIIVLRNYCWIFDFRQKFFQCRQPILTTVYIISFLFLLYVLNPVTLFLSNVYGTNSQIPIYVHDVGDILIFLVFFPRAWILYCDRQFVDNMKNWLWRREINIQDTNFLIKYRKHLNSPHRIVYSIYLLLVAPVFMTLVILPHYNIWRFNCHVLKACLLSFLLWTTFKAVNKISVVTDEHQIKPELLSSVKTTGIAYILASISVILELVDPHVALLVEILFVCIANLFVIYYTCHWTRLRFVFTKKLEFLKQMKGNKRMRRSSFSSFLTKRVSFHDILEHRNGVEAFCTHLANEFGLESMIFLLEVTQFKAIIRRASNNRLPDNVPDLIHYDHRHGSTSLHEQKSFTILSAANILNIEWLPIDPRMFSLTPYQIALYLYDKYIEESADLCINISFGIRKGIYRYFAEVSKQKNASLHDIKLDNDILIMDENDALVKMYKIYDAAFTEIWRLLQTDSFIRFKTTEEFRRLVSFAFPDEAQSVNKSIVEMVDKEINEQMKKDQQSKLEIVIEDQPTKKPTLIERLSSNKKKKQIFMILNDDLNSGSQTINSLDISHITSKNELLSNSHTPNLYSPETAPIETTPIEEMNGNVTSKTPYADIIEMKTNANQLPLLEYEQRSLPVRTSVITSFASTMLKLTYSNSLPPSINDMKSKMSNNEKCDQIIDQRRAEFERIYSQSGTVSELIVS